jgi:hypothetical protein
MFEANAAPRPKICTKELEQKGRRGFFARKMQLVRALATFKFGSNLPFFGGVARLCAVAHLDRPFQ